MRLPVKYIIPFAFAAAALAGTAQNPPTVRAKIYPDSIAIGDRFKIEISVDKDLMQVVDFPSYQAGEAEGSLEFVSESGVDTVRRDSRRMTVKKEYTMTIFDEGLYSLGKFPVLYLDKNVVDTLYSYDSLSLLVTTFEIDTTTQKIFDIKAPMRAPLKFSEFGGYLILGLVILQILIAVIYVLVKVYGKPKERKPAKPLEPAHIIAIRELEKLEEEKLWQSNRHKLYYTRLTNIIREYLEHRYGINAMEMTTDETMDELEDILGEGRSRIHIRRLLSTADYVKFAKYVPSIEDNEMSYSDAYYFVEDTKFVAEIKENEPENEEDE